VQRGQGLGERRDRDASGRGWLSANVKEAIVSQKRDIPRKGISPLICKGPSFLFPRRRRVQGKKRKKERARMSRMMMRPGDGPSAIRIEHVISEGDFTLKEGRVDRHPPSLSGTEQENESEKREEQGEKGDIEVAGWPRKRMW